MKSLIILILFILSFNTFAVKVVKKDDKVPFDGVLFTMEEEKNLRKKQEKLIKLEHLRVLHEEKMEIQAQRITIYQGMVKDLKPLTGWEKAIWVGVGVLATGLLFYGTAKVLDHVR